MCLQKVAFHIKPKSCGDILWFCMTKQRVKKQVEMNSWYPSMKVWLNWAAQYFSHFAITFFSGCLTFNMLKNEQTQLSCQIYLLTSTISNVVYWLQQVVLWRIYSNFLKKNSIIYGQTHYLLYDSIANYSSITIRTTLLYNIITLNYYSLSVPTSVTDIGTKK